MKDLILIRHGEAEGIGGWNDYPLTALGKRQAKLTGERLHQLLNQKDYRFYSSDLVRARETAEIIGSFINKKTRLFKELRGIHHGIVSNTNPFVRQLPIKESRFDWIPNDQAESMRMFYQRVYSFMDHMDLEESTSVIVTHAKTLTCLVNWWLGITEVHHLNKIIYQSDFCSISYLTTNANGYRKIERLNDISHLSGTNYEQS
ncbi:putative phosphoglycerate mutase [Laceyella sediminis]|uniref:Phosphoglycerate mutase n=1 Tax=Laceyella sediminis TaxID=573074 RepID=A0ABX5EL77_9BACL|nr:histidine phosphatase family protein [Laceyella sediminis]PRZ12683.1 putative phosphoglycerate mutase [Laceyella sediminis]